MRSVIFVAYSMNVGGVEKALLAVLKRYVSEGWDVHLALLSTSGGLLNALPAQVHIHKIKDFSRLKPLLHNPLRSQIRVALSRIDIKKLWLILGSLFQKCIFKTNYALYKRAFSDVPVFSKKKFDLAVAFAGPFSFIDYYVATKINASQKWGWIHYDISKFYCDKHLISKVYKNFDRINVVSKKAKEIFDAYFPQFKTNTHYEPNIIDTDEIHKLSQERLNEDLLKDCEENVVLLTVGRVSKEKGQYLALEAFKTLLNQGVRNVIWWFVGYGNDIERCKRFVSENGLMDSVRFLGSDINPYKYMKACDIYIQPSLHEGFCITLGEALLFDKQMIATNFSGANEQLKGRGKIVNFSAEELSVAILESLQTIEVPS